MTDSQSSFIKQSLEQFQKYKKTSIAALALIALMIALQVTAINSFTINQISDAAVYRDIAMDIASKNRFYPNEDYLNSDYIFNPGYVNYLSLYYRVSQSDYAPLYGNVVLTVIQVILIFFIAVRLFGSVLTGLISVMLFAAFPSNVFEVMHMRTELPYTVLVFGAAALVLSRVKGRYVIAGVLISVANFMRPLAVSMLIAIALQMILQKSPLRSYLSLLLGVLSAVVLIGVASYANTGHFIYQSTTGGYNLLMGANDDAKGNYETGKEVFGEGKAGYLENPSGMTFKEKDDFYVSEAVKWIKENPVKYISLFPMKLVYMYAADTYSFNPVYGNEVRTGAASYVIDNLLAKLMRFEMLKMDWREWLVLCNQGLYMLIFLLALVSCFRMIFIKKTFNAALMLAAIVITGTGLTILTVGGSRYHYPFMPAFFMFSAGLIREIAEARYLNRRSKEPRKKA